MSQLRCIATWSRPTQRPHSL